MDRVWLNQPQIRSDTSLNRLAPLMHADILHWRCWETWALLICGNKQRCVYHSYLVELIHLWTKPLQTTQQSEAQSVVGKYHEMQDWRLPKSFGFTAHTHLRGLYKTQHIHTQKQRSYQAAFSQITQIFNSKIRRATPWGLQLHQQQPMTACLHITAFN